MPKIDGRPLRVIHVQEKWGVFEEAAGTLGTARHGALETDARSSYIATLVNGGWHRAR
jgi:hypothetical protein